MKTILISMTLILQFTAVAQEVKVFEKFDNLENYVFEGHPDTTYVVNFWATWCAPCVKELPYFEELSANNRGKRFKQYLVTLDTKKDLERRVLPFIQKNNITSEVVLLADGKANSWIDRVDKSWSGAIPITVFYKGGNRIFLEREFHSVEELQAEVDKVNKNLNN